MDTVNPAPVECEIRGGADPVETNYRDVGFIRP